MKTRTSSKVVAVCGVVAAIFMSNAAEAQNYPVKPVRVITPWPSGGLTDVAGRLVFAKISESMGQQFVIENRPGATGSIGADAVAKAQQDGYTLMVHSASHLSNADTYPKLPYDTFRDFAPIGLLVAQTGLLVVHPSLPVKSVKDLVTLARAQPGQLLYASSGGGSFSHMAFALLNSMTNTKMLHVPYKGGGPATTAVVSGESQMLAGTPAAVLTQLQSNRLRALGVTSDTRLKQFPNVPTIAESGVPGYEFRGWVGVFAPAGTPKPIVDRMNAEIKKVLERPDNKLDSLEPWYMTPEQMAARMKTDYEKYGRIFKIIGTKFD
ncbi:MAG: Bug family tripartite tricarboxylate transporter substrate binding protein [Burkholderiales bacterium]